MIVEKIFEKNKDLVIEIKESKKETWRSLILRDRSERAKDLHHVWGKPKLHKPLTHEKSTFPRISQHSKAAKRSRTMIPYYN